MRPTPVQLLALWEQGGGRSLLGRALLLLTMWLDQPEEAIARLTIGQRDFALLNLRAALFGPDLSALATCPACGKPVELRLNCDTLAASPSPGSGETADVVHDDYQVTFRLPTSLDLNGLPMDAGPAAGRQCLLERCLIRVRPGENDVPNDGLPEALIRAITEGMAEADPLADIELSISCPECRHAWEAPFDIVSFLWSEISAWAERLLAEVHVLASAYGWSEHDILRLGAPRRQFYLQMISG
jgi:hypothetical protein